MAYNMRCPELKGYKVTYDLIKSTGTYDKNKPIITATFGYCLGEECAACVPDMGSRTLYCKKTGRFIKELDR